MNNSHTKCADNACDSKEKKRLRNQQQKCGHGVTATSTERGYRVTLKQ
jgi:hypothetical protein